MVKVLTVELLEIGLLKKYNQQEFLSTSSDYLFSHFAKNIPYRQADASILDAMCCWNRSYYFDAQPQNAEKRVVSL